MIKRTYKQLLQRLRTPDKLIVPWDIQWLPIILIILDVVVFLLSLIFVTTWMDTPLGSPDPVVLVWVYLLSTLLTFVLTIQYIGQHIIVARADRRIKGDVLLWDWLYLNPSPTTSLFSITLLAFALAVVVDTIGLVLGVSETSLPTPLAGLDEDADTFPFVMAAFVLVVFRPIVDEIIFRGVLYPALAKQMRPWYAIGVGAGVYAITHYMLDPQHLWWGLVVPLVIGLVAGISRAASKSTQNAIAVSAMFGLFAVLRAIVS